MWSNENVLQNGLGEVEVMRFKEGMVISLLAMCCCSSILQVYVCTVAISQIRRRASERCMHIFLLNMTAADLLLTGIGYPMEFLQDVYDLGFNYYVNVLMHFLLWLGTAVSGLSLVLLNLDKLVFFKFPLNYSKRITRGKAICLAICTWICSALFIYTAFVTHAFECRYNCQTLTTPTGSRYGPLIYLLFTCCVSVFPAISSLSVALYLLRVVSTHRKQIAEGYLLIYHLYYCNNFKFTF
uniref:G_PROTEIN_RECEP_F1_2 domain-containing protein n=1 Tax=Ascaris lumbricoides TaxID=6252 RepID=A0A0M3HZ31_ASCLU